MSQDLYLALASTIAGLKRSLDERRPVAGRALEGLAHWYDVELTYSSNAIEGNTLTLSETQIVVEKGITIGGKPVKDHIEALDLFAATKAMRALAAQSQPVSDDSALLLHRLVMDRSGSGMAGRYADLPRRLSGSRVVFPRPEMIPGLMHDLGRKLERTSGWDGAFEAHFDLVDTPLLGTATAGPRGSS